MKKLYVKKSKIDRSGLFSNNKIAKNEFISYVKGPITILKNNDEATKKNVENWIGVGRYSWINTDDSIFRYINHSCEPNAIIKGKRSVYALVDIPNETEITIDYSLTESEHDWKIGCHCNLKNCRGKIRAISYVPKNIIKKYSKYLSPNFKRIYEIDTRRVKLFAE